MNEGYFATFSSEVADEVSCPVIVVGGLRSRKVELNETAFIHYYQNGSAEKALEKDLEYAHRLGIHSLPAYTIQYGEKALIMQSFEYQEFAKNIMDILSDQ